MRRALAAALSALLLVGVAGCGGGDSATSATAASATLPDVTLPSLRTDGTPIDLGTLKGPAVVNLWANWCKPCRAEMPIIEEFHQADPAVRVVGVNVLDTQPGLARQVAEEAGVTYPLLVDEHQAIASASRGLPQTLLVDAKGRIAYVAPGGFTSVAELESLVKKHLPTAGAAS